MPNQPSAQPQLEITQLLHNWTNGDTSAFQQLFEYVYQDLRIQARNFIRRERPGHVLQATGLVNEVYMKLERAAPVAWKDRKHFRRICTLGMIRILQDIARQDHFLGRVDQISTGFDLLNKPPRDWDDLHDALLALEKFDPRAAQVIELKFFHGLTYTQIGEELGWEEKTMRTDCKKACAWLYAELDRKHEQRSLGTSKATDGSDATA